MLKKSNYFKTMLILSMGFFVGCQESDDVVPGVGEGKIGMAFVLGSESNSQPNAKVANNNLEIMEGFIQIKELEMELKGRNKDGRFEKEYEVKFDEIKKVPFNQFDESSDFFFNIPEAEYKEIEMELDLIDHRNEPSIYLEGRYLNQAGQTIPVIFEYFGDDIDFEVEIESDRDDQYFKVDRSNNPLALLELNAYRWFRDVNSGELENATIEDGKIQINRNTNRSMYSRIVKRIEASSEIEIELK